jgi:hypothetical protein
MPKEYKTLPQISYLFALSKRFDSTVEQVPVVSMTALPPLCRAPSSLSDHTAFPSIRSKKKIQDSRASERRASEIVARAEVSAFGCR